MNHAIEIDRPDGATWRSSRLLRCGGLLIVSLPLVALALVHLCGMQLLYWIGSVAALGGVALLDLCAEDDATHLSADRMKALSRDLFYQRLLYATVAIEYVSVAAVLWVVSSTAIPWYHQFGLALTLGVGTAVTINTSHELGHRPSRLLRWIARFALIPAAYVHFHIEHNRGHHVRVATPEDPASARYGETFRRFLPRSVIGGIVSAWRLERARLARSSRSVFHPTNEMIQGVATTLLLWTLAVACFGVSCLPVLLLQAFYGVTLLESVNYVEHYGLARQRGTDGRYEACGPEHSWNANSLASNLFLYNLQRHSDHHANPLIPYQVLRSHATAPQLPAGYAAMIMCAHVPRLWFRVMNPRVQRHYGGNLQLANLGPSKADR